MPQADAGLAKPAAGLLGKLQSPFDQPGDREARQIRMVLPNGPEAHLER